MLFGMPPMGQRDPNERPGRDFMQGLLKANVDKAPCAFVRRVDVSQAFAGLVQAQWTVGPPECGAVGGDAGGLNKSERATRKDLRRCVVEHRRTACPGSH